MPCINLRMPAVAHSQGRSSSSPLPHLLQTPSGLAILEIQGTIHGPHDAPSDFEHGRTSVVTPLGRLEFPLYDGQDNGEGNWMKKVYLYIGKHQRMTGEVKKLGKPLGIIRKFDIKQTEVEDADTSSDLELVDIVKYKLLFNARPEPVGE